MNDTERIIIRDWATELVSNNKMDQLKHDRLVRILDKNDKLCPPLIFEIKNRVVHKENLTFFENETYINDFVTVVLKNGFIQKHTDPNDINRQLFHVRFNIFITVPKKGGATYYDGHEIDAIEGSYVLCRSGIDQHWSDPLEDENIMRISLSFGFLLPAHKVDELTNNKSVGIYTQYYPLATQNINYLTIVLNNLNSIKDKFDLVERGEIGSGIFTISSLLIDIQCDFIKEYINNHSSLWEDRDVNYVSGNNVECKFLDMANIMSLKIPLANEIDDCIFKLVNNILKKFHELYPSFFKGTSDSGYTLRKIYGGTKLHADGVHSKTGGFKNFVRCLSLIIVLNDDYDGGIFNFPNQGLKLKVKKGEAIMFPPYWTHPHSVTSVGEGQARYTINTWILEKFID